MDRALILAIPVLVTALVTIGALLLADAQFGRTAAVPPTATVRAPAVVTPAPAAPASPSPIIIRVTATPTSLPSPSPVAAVPTLVPQPAATLPTPASSPTLPPNTPTPASTATHAPAPATSTPTSAPTSAPSATPTPAPTVEPTATPSAPRRARVTNTDGQGANMRREPNAASPRIGVLRDGTDVEVIGDEREAEGKLWLNVKDGDGDVGWVVADFLALLEPGAAAAGRPLPPPTIQVTSATASVAREKQATVVIQTRPGVTCVLEVFVFGPGAAPRDGLGRTTANERGECSWTWTVPKEVVPGTWRYLVTVISGETRITREVPFTVT